MSPPFPPSADLVAVLDSDADLQKKAFACQQLAVVGEPAAVPALARLLADDKLADYARSALEMIAAPAAGAALRQALHSPAAAPIAASPPPPKAPRPSTPVRECAARGIAIMPLFYPLGGFFF